MRVGARVSISASRTPRPGLIPGGDARDRDTPHLSQVHPDARRARPRRWRLTRTSSWRLPAPTRSASSTTPAKSSTSGILADETTGMVELMPDGSLLYFAEAASRGIEHAAWCCWPRPAARVLGRRADVGI